MKVIFLDFDGVLNSVRYHVARHESGLDRHALHGPCLDSAAIRVLNAVVEATQAVVVVTSTWRIGENRVQLASWLRDAGFRGRVVGATRRIPGAQRSIEIQDWLDGRVGASAIDFVILDDDTDMEHLYDKLVHIDDQEGLTEAYLPAILKHLEG